MKFKNLPPNKRHPSFQNFLVCEEYLMSVEDLLANHFTTSIHSWNEMFSTGNSSLAICWKKRSITESSPSLESLDITSGVSLINCSNVSACSGSRMSSEEVQLSPDWLFLGTTFSSCSVIEHSANGIRSDTNESLFVSELLNRFLESLSFFLAGDALYRGDRKGDFIAGDLSGVLVCFMPGHGLKRTLLLFRGKVSRGLNLVIYLKEKVCNM